MNTKNILSIIHIGKFLMLFLMVSTFNSVILNSKYSDKRLITKQITNIISKSQINRILKFLQSSVENQICMKFLMKYLHEMQIYVDASPPHLSRYVS